MTKLLVAVWLVLVGCGAIPYKYDLDAPMPQYDITEAVDHYELINVLKVKYSQLNQVLMALNQQGVKLSDAQINAVYGSIDKYLYWSSVATIQLFYKEYDKSDESSIKSNDGLEELKKKLVEIIEASST